MFRPATKSREEVINLFNYFIENTSSEYLIELNQKIHLAEMLHCATNWPLDFARFLVNVHAHHSYDSHVSRWFEFILCVRYNDKSLIDLLAMNSETLPILETLRSTQYSLWKNFFVALETRILEEDIEFQTARLLSLEITPSSDSNSSGFFNNSQKNIARDTIKNATKSQNDFAEFFHGLTHQSNLYVSLLKEPEFQSTLLETARRFPVPFISCLYCALELQNNDSISRLFDSFSEKDLEDLSKSLRSREALITLCLIIESNGIPNNESLFKIILSISPELIVERPSLS